MTYSLRLFVILLKSQPIVKVTLKHTYTFCRYTDSDFDKVFIVLIFAGNNPKLFKFLLKTAYLYQEPWCDFFVLQLLSLNASRLVHPVLLYWNTGFFLLNVIIGWMTPLWHYRTRNSCSKCFYFAIVEHC